MSYLAYLYDKSGELIEVVEVSTPEARIFYLPPLNLRTLEREIQEGTIDMNAPLPVRSFAMIDQGHTVSGLPRLVYQEL